MKSSQILFAASIALTLVACTDHKDHVAAREDATSAAPATKAMSMKATDARIAALTQKSTDCNIESVNGAGFEPTVPTIPTAGAAKVSGWLIDADQKVVPTQVKLRVETEAGDKAWEQPVIVWGDRGDIVTTHGGVAAYRKSGFEISLDLGELSAGSYNTYLLYDSHGSEIACAVGRRFDMK